MTEEEIQESEITRTSQKDKGNTHPTDPKENEINESLYNIKNFFKQIKDETGKVVNIVISNVNSLLLVRIIHKRSCCMFNLDTVSLLVHASNVELGLYKKIVLLSRV